MFRNHHHTADFWAVLQCIREMFFQIQTLCMFNPNISSFKEVILIPSFVEIICKNAHCDDTAQPICLQTEFCKNAGCHKVAKLRFEKSKIENHLYPRMTNFIDLQGRFRDNRNRGSIPSGPAWGSKCVPPGVRGDVQVLTPSFRSVSCSAQSSDKQQIISRPLDPRDITWVWYHSASHLILS